MQDKVFVYFVYKYIIIYLYSGLSFKDRIISNLSIVKNKYKDKIISKIVATMSRAKCLPENLVFNCVTYSKLFKYIFF